MEECFPPLTGIGCCMPYTKNNFPLLMSFHVAWCRSQSVVDVLEKAASSSGVQVVCGTKVLSVDTSVASTPTTEGGSNISNEARFAIVTQGEGKLPVKLSVGENGDYLLCDRVIVATGSSR